MPVSEELYGTLEEKDDEAKEMYRSLLLKWANRANPANDEPSNNCLAIARQVFCRYKFKRCRDYLAPA